MPQLNSAAQILARLRGEEGDTVRAQMHGDVLGGGLWGAGSGVLIGALRNAGFNRRKMLRDALIGLPLGAGLSAILSEPDPESYAQAPEQVAGKRVGQYTGALAGLAPGAVAAAKLLNALNIQHPRLSALSVLAGAGLGATAGRRLGGEAGSGLGSLLVDGN